MLDALCARMGARHAVLQVLTREGDRLRGPRRIGNSTHEDGPYDRLVSDDNNPRLDAARLNRRNVVGSVMGDDQLFDQGEGDRKAAFLAKMNSIGCGRFLGGVVMLDATRYFGLALHRDPHSPDDYTPAQREQLAALIPHLVQAMSLREQIGAFEAREADERWRDDRRPFGSLVVDASARIEWMNALARDLLPSAVEGVSSGPRRLRVWTASQTVALQRAIERRARTAEGADYLVVQGLRGALHVVLQQLPDSSAIGKVLVTVTSPQRVGHVPVEALMGLLGVTEAEACLAADLIMGISTEEHALRRGITLGTARWYMKQLLAKTGSARQHELVRLILSSAAFQAVATLRDR